METSTTVLILDLLFTMIPLLYIGGIIFCAACATERTIGVLTAIFVAIFFSPVIAIICIYCTESKEQKKQREEMLKAIKECTITTSNTPATS